MIIYFLKTVLILGIMYLLYIMLLKPTKAFRWNRVYLLSTSCLAMLLPLMANIDFLSTNISPQSQSTLTITLDTINVYASKIQTNNGNGVLIFLIIYVVGVIWSISRIIVGINSIRKVRINSQLEKIEAQDIYFSNHLDSPFSFFGNVYIPAMLKNTEMLHIVIKHEKAHIQLRHSHDKIYFSVLQAFCWFNPFVYSYHKELELVHEFEADEYTTQEIARDTYIDNLLKTLQYDQVPNLLVHHFFHHPIKTRIIMLYKKSKNAIWQKTTVILLGIFAFTSLHILQSYGQQKQPKDKYKYRTVNNSADTIYVEDPNGNLTMKIVQKMSSNNIVYENADTAPQFACGKMSLEDFVKDNLVYPEDCIKEKIEGKVVLSFVISEDGFIYEYDIKEGADKRLVKAAEDLINRMPRWTPAKINGESVAMQLHLPISFKL
jgi:beta-lactamase regulating signal transducer with metallopeptidase domain